MALPLLLVALPWFVREALPNPRRCWSGSPLIKRSLFSISLWIPQWVLLFTLLYLLSALLFLRGYRRKQIKSKGVKVNGLAHWPLGPWRDPSARVHGSTSRMGSRGQCPASTGEEGRGSLPQRTSLRTPDTDTGSRWLSGGSSKAAVSYDLCKEALSTIGRVFHQLRLQRREGGVSTFRTI